jgi:hypothetical protein
MTYMWRIPSITTHIPLTEHVRTVRVHICSSFAHLVLFSLLVVWPCLDIDSRFVHSFGVFSFRQYSFSPIVLFANWRIYYGETKNIGEFPHDIRQLANILRQEQIFFFYVQLSRACALCDFRMHRIELDNEDIVD